LEGRQATKSFSEFDTVVEKTNRDVRLISG